MRAGAGWAELELGSLPELFFAVHRLDFDDAIEDDTAGRFHVLNLVERRRDRGRVRRRAARIASRTRRRSSSPQRSGRTGSGASAAAPCKVVKAFVP